MKSKRSSTSSLEMVEPLSKQFKAGNGEAHRSEEICTVSRLRPRTVSLSHQSDFLGSFVPTPRVVNELGLVIPPPGWQVNSAYAALWNPDFSGPEVSVEDHNDSVAEVADVAWLIAGIRHVKVAVLGSGVVEVLSLSWKPCWVPLHMVCLDSEHLKTQVTLRKKKYGRLGDQAKNGMRHTIPAHVGRVLALARLTKESTFLVKQVIKFAVITVPDLGDNVEVIKADFKDTFEHSSALFTNKELWKELCRRRVEAARSHLTSEKDSTIMREFLRRNEDALRTAEE